MEMADVVREIARIRAQRRADEIKAKKDKENKELEDDVATIVGLVCGRVRAFHEGGAVDEDVLSFTECDYVIHGDADEYCNIVFESALEKLWVFGIRFEACGGCFTIVLKEEV